MELLQEFSNVHSYIHAAIEEKNIPGAVVTVLRKGKKVLDVSYGYAEKYKLEKNRDNYNIKIEADYLNLLNPKKRLLEQPVPMTTKHLYDLASLTKVVTTIGIMLLIDQGKLKLDDKVKDHIPEFNRQDKKFITIRHLLEHTSGFTPTINLFYYEINNESEVINFLNHLPLEYTTGTQRRYSDLGFILLRYVIERASKQEFEEFLQRHLFEKLNLRNILFNPIGKKDKLVSTSHGDPYKFKEKTRNRSQWRCYTLKGEVHDPNTFHVFKGKSGHAGLFGSSEEFGKLMELLLRHGRDEKGNQLIRQETVDQFLTPNAFTDHGIGLAMKAPPIDSPDFKAGDLPLGKFGETKFAKGTFGHTGFTGTYAVGIPELDLVVTIFANPQNFGTDQEGRYNLRAFRANVLNLIVEAVINNVLIEEQKNCLSPLIKFPQQFDRKESGNKYRNRKLTFSYKIRI